LEEKQRRGRLANFFYAWKFGTAFGFFKVLKIVFKGKGAKVSIECLTTYLLPSLMTVFFRG